MTGYPDENIEEKAAAAGIRHVLLKPYLEENLVSRIRGAIQEGIGRRTINAAARPPVNYLGAPLKISCEIVSLHHPRRVWSSAAEEMAHAHPIAQHLH